VDGPDVVAEEHAVLHVAGHCEASLVIAEVAAIQRGRILHNYL
jgi:hypothetical protein